MENKEKAKTKTELKLVRSSTQKPKEKIITHVYFHDKYLKKIPKFANPRNLAVMYLHNNEIYEISNLDFTTNLTSLYLQNNRIIKITNLGSLQKLKKLYLGHNTISVVEGLEKLENLEELYLEKQFLYEGNSLCFDPRSIFSVSNTLQVLNISHNKIQTISSLAPLRFLKVLNASHNDLSDIEEVCTIIKDWFYLKELCFIQNPICKNRLYKEDIIANVYCLEILDQKNISEHTRSFLKRLHGERVSQKLQKHVNFADKITEIPKNYPTAVQKAVSISVLKQSRNNDLTGDNLEIFDEKNAVYIPWRTLPHPQSVSKLHLMKKHRKIQKEKIKNKTDNNFSNIKI